MPHICQWIRSALVQIMACHLFGAKPISKPMQVYCPLDPQWNLNKIPKFSFTKMYLNIVSAKWRPLFPGGDELSSITFELTSWLCPFLSWFNGTVPSSKWQQHLLEIESFWEFVHTIIWIWQVLPNTNFVHCCITRIAAVNRSFSFTKTDFNYLHHHSGKKWYKT